MNDLHQSGDYKEIRCQNDAVHFHFKGEGKLLAVIGPDGLYFMCPDRRCKRWFRAKFHFPGVDLNYSKAALSLEMLPKGTRLPAGKMCAVVEQEMEQE